MYSLYNIFWDSCTRQSSREAFSSQRCLRGRLEQNHISSNDCWEDRIDRRQVREAALFSCGTFDARMITYFHGAITNTTPKAVRLMYRLNPGLSVSVRGTSAREDSAMDNI